MKNLYSPWRASYLRKIAKNEILDCVFCHKLANIEAAQNLIFYQNQYCAGLLNRFPYNPGHLLIIPRQHAANLFELDENTLQAMWILKQQLSQALIELFGASSIEIGFNLGIVAGAGIPGHVHEHLLPRYFGDTQIDFTALPPKPDLLEYKDQLIKFMHNALKSD